MGALLQQGLREVFTGAGVPASVIGYPSMPFVQFAFEDAARQEAYVWALFRATTARGILLHPSHQWFLSAAHTPDDIEFAIDAVRAATEVAAAAVEAAVRLRSASGRRPRQAPRSVGPSGSGTRGGDGERPS
jgi:glutamate-1-semialdehyde aminotransferase